MIKCTHQLLLGWQLVGGDEGQVLQRAFVELRKVLDVLVVLAAAEVYRGAHAGVDLQHRAQLSAM